MEFYGSRKGLKVKDGWQIDWLITARFNQNENYDKFATYMRKVAAKLAGMEPFSDEMADFLEEAESKVRAAEVAERFLEEVSF